jgi:hypothetical protein
LNAAIIYFNPAFFAVIKGMFEKKFLEVQPIVKWWIV